MDGLDTDRQKITQILQNPGTLSNVSDQLLPLVYNQLRRLAARQMSKEAPGQTLQPTELVHEAYLRLMEGADVRWEGRGHFYAAAARSMRQILVNRALRKRAKKHGGDLQRQEFGEDALAVEPPPERLLALDEALTRLEEFDPRKVEIVMLRFFAGLNIEDTAKSLGVSTATVKRDWTFARTWLHREMNR